MVHFGGLRDEERRVRLGCVRGAVGDPQERKACKMRFSTLMADSGSLRKPGGLFGAHLRKNICGALWNSHATHLPLVVEGS